MKKTRWVPYVGDADMPAAFANANVRNFPRTINPQRCATCGAPDSPFGSRDPSSINSEYTWFCRQHVRTIMPEVETNMVRVRLDQVRKKCPFGAALWLDLLIAADNGDLGRCRKLWGEIRNVSIEASDLLKSLNAEKDNG